MSQKRSSMYSTACCKPSRREPSDNGEGWRIVEYRARSTETILAACGYYLRICMSTTRPDLRVTRERKLPGAEPVARNVEAKQKRKTKG